LDDKSIMSKQQMALAGMAQCRVPLGRSVGDARD
jgi:hypothetical protein